MSSWPTWLLRAWIVVTLLVGVGAAVDARPFSDAADRRVARAPLSGGAEPSSPEIATDAAPAASPPPTAVPVRVEAPAVGISAELAAVGKTDDGALEVPDFGTAGWYEQSARPGAPGPAVLAGHVDSTSGPDVFFALRDLTDGDEILVHRGDGSIAMFVVDHIETIDKDELPVDRIFGATDAPSLRLVTCGGAFDRSVRSYESNVIVYARAVVPTTDGAGTTKRA